MSLNIIDLLPKKSYATSENVEKVSGGFYGINEPMVTNIDTMEKENK